MGNVLLLTKVQLRTAFSFHSSKPRKNSILFYSSFAAVVLILTGASFFYSYTLGVSLLSFRDTDSQEILVLLPELMMALTSVLTLVTTIYKVRGTLFGFKDYDMIMSLPVRTGEIVASRLLLLYLINLLFTLIVMIPAGIVYGIFTKASFLYYIIHMFTVFFIPLIPIILASAIGTIILVIALKFKYSNSIHLLLTLILFGGVTIYSFRAEDSPEFLEEVSKILAKQVERIYPLAAMYKRAVSGMEWASLLAFIAISILSFLFFSFIVGRGFKYINTYLSATSTKSDYKIGRLSEGSSLKALYQKELKRFLSSNLYILNTAIGLVMMTIGAVALVIMGEDRLAAVLEIPELAVMFKALVPIFISGCVATCCITACSISLEGKNLWILKSAPVSVFEIFLSKIAVSLTFTLPTILLNTLIISIGLNLSFKEILMTLLMPAGYAVFIAAAGLIINLHLPNLNWTTEVSAIKQSAAALTAIFLGLFSAIIPGVAVVLSQAIIPTFLVNCLITGIIVLSSLFMLYYLKTRGSRLFMEL